MRAAPGYKSSLEYTILPTPTQALPQYAYTMATQALKWNKQKEQKRIAHTRIRTEDLIITSDALYQLSHAS